MHSRNSDVVVIGAGIIGASIAWRLAQAGLRIAVVDAGSLGGEASWAGAGMLAPGGEIMQDCGWAELALESLAGYGRFVRELGEESGAEIDYQARGAVELAFTPEEWEALRERAAAQSALGIPSENLDGRQLRELVPMLRRDVPGALYFPNDAVVNPRHVTYALHIACARRQVEIHEHRRVTALRLRDGSIEVDTGPGILAAAAAVLSAGAWSSGIAVLRPGAEVALPPAFPVKGHLLGYRLAPGSLRPILRHDHTYMLQRANGFTVAGSSEQRVGFDRGIDERITADIHQRACAILPQLSQCPQYEPWVGFRPAVEGELQIRRVPHTSLWLSYGHFRNGILLAPVTARRMSDEIIASSGKGLPSTAGSR